VTTQTKPVRRPVRPGQAAGPAGGLAAALREWRGRRRVSQLELALRAGTTQRHVSFIESGRSVPGRAMVVRLAESLEVPLRERNALLLAAGYAPAYRKRTSATPASGRSAPPWSASWPGTSRTRPWSSTGTAISSRPTTASAR
jgi:transcriptional regulator with XRE-family HTH domain